MHICTVYIYIGVMVKMVEDHFSIAVFFVRDVHKTL